MAVSGAWRVAGLLACAMIFGCDCGGGAVVDGGAGGGGGDLDGGSGGGVGGGGGDADGGAGGGGMNGTGGGGGGTTDGGACTLKGNGEACAADGECCSARCDPLTNTCTTGTGACQAIGQTCQSNVECCGGRTCAADGTGVKRCVDESFCKAGGQACAAASECCGFSCGACGSDGGGCSCQESGTLCRVAGTACGADTDCCSGNCTGGTCVSAGAGCATFGERCANPGYDANCCSKYCVNYAGDAGTDLRCAPSSTCRARGEICTDPSDCCAGTCTSGRCPSQAQLGQKLFVGEPCRADSDCASYACASNFPGGPKVCQYLGGCRPAEEVCSEDYECCGYLELSSPCTTATPSPGVCATVAGVTGLKRCRLQPTDKEVGEICESSGNPVHSCCGGSAACRPTITGVSRCFGVVGPTDGGCLGSGEACSIADQCCTRICAPKTQPDGGARLECSACVVDGQACTTSADCCTFSCVNGACQGVVVNDAGVPPADGGSPLDAGTTPVDAGPPPCRPLGATCTQFGECCSGLCSSNDGGAGTCITIG